jgi:hypothetical protein
MKDDKKRAALPPDGFYIAEVNPSAVRHNYEKEIERLVAAGTLKRGEVTFIEVAHDDWCGLYKQKPCDCDVDLIDMRTGQKLNA